eukprot:TRINITY_DN816_c0_g1_i4.p1 TRINITY_DN816_c0_g1~~TRINITY_DN816_c0_g1_i4.p1  ORF type:complete len:310 (-),score=58.41 TRINITY_DN816_c0_g1_i4:197-1126(-)
MSHGVAVQQQLEINCLRVAHTALGDGILSAADYEEIKGGFLKSQQMRAGSEAGLLGNEDYDEAKRSFVASFASVLHAATGGGHSNARGKTTHHHHHHAPQTHHAPTQHGNSNFTAKRLEKKPIFKPEQAPAHSSHAVVRPQGNADDNQNGIKVDVPELGGAAAADKSSMSGIKVHPDTINLFNYVKAKRAHKWMTYRLNEAGMELVVADVGTPDSKYEDFIKVFPENQCRYGIFDWQYVNKDDEVFQKLVFIHWAPNIASVKNKMMYASTKDFFKGFLDGISVEVQATDVDELQEDAVYEAVRATIVRK